jgi:hypothetical protein
MVGVAARRLVGKPSHIVRRWLGEDRRNIRRGAGPSGALSLPIAKNVDGEH